MSQRRRHLRQKPRISYYEIEEPSFDEYVYCDKCGDNVYEYCSIHGPLLVIPDEKVTAQSNYPSDVPRAALSIPHVFLHIASSAIPGAGAGVFASLTLPRGVQFGPYRGRRTKEVTSAYCWQVYDGNNKPSHAIDGEDHTRSNWMRYVNCARHSVEQNLVAYQYQGEVYYRTIKIIPRSTELLVFYGTEYASTLQIDLRKYNSKNHYLQAIGYNSPALEHKDKTAIEHVESQKPYYDASKEVSTTTTIEIASADVVSTVKEISNAYEIEDDFRYIDDASVLAEDSQPMIIDEDKLLTVEFNTEKNSFDIAFHNNDKPNKFNELTKINGNEFTTELSYSFKNDFKNNRNISVHTNDKAIQVNFDFNDHQLRAYKSIQTQTIDSETEKRTNEYNNNDGKNYMETVYSNNFTKIVGDKVVWRCNKCLKILTSRTSLKQHKGTHNEIKMYNCTECEYKTDFKYKLGQHMSVHTGCYGNKCDLCPFATNSSYKLKKHVQNIHENGPICELCDYKTPNRLVMEKHKKMHETKNVMKCNYCDFLTMPMSKLKKHVQEVHEKHRKKHSEAGDEIKN